MKNSYSYLTKSLRLKITNHLHMKLLISAFLVGCLCHVHAQNYLDQSSKWTESSGFCGFDGTCTTTDYMITMNGDTVVNGKTYFKTQETGTVTIYDLMGDSILSVEPFSIPSHLIREEQSKFYRYDADLSDDILFADFNLEVGDTAVSTGCNSLRIVDHIDTIYLGNIPRKHFFFSPDSGFISASLIEGVGSTKGLYQSPCAEVGIEFGSALLCYSQNGNLMQVDTAADCSQSVSVFPNSSSISKFTLSPNPAKDYLNIIATSTISPVEYDIKLFDLRGKLLMHHIIEDTFIGSVDISKLTTGLYIVVIFEGQKMFSYKVIKTH